MMDILITPGNTNMMIFEVVCRAVQAAWPDTIGHIYLLDTHSSSAMAIEEKREALLRGIFGTHLEICTALVDENNLQAQIPDRLSRILQSFASRQIVVDLTNGQKFTASVLYATASISQIKRIYSLLPKRRFEEADRGQLANLRMGVDYEYVHLEPLLDIQNVARSSFLELVYYRDEIESVTRVLHEQDERFAYDARGVLLHSLSDYFVVTADHGADEVNEKYISCVASLGKLCEEVAERLYAYLFQIGVAPEVRRPGFHTYVQKISTVLAEMRNVRLPKAFDQAQERLKPLVVADGLLEMVKTYRNLADHPKGYLYTPDRHDAKLNLDATLLLLLRLSKTNVLTETVRKS